MLMTACIKRRVKEPFWRDSISLKLKTRISGMDDKREQMNYST
jgi:hypothetical protein